MCLFHVMFRASHIVPARSISPQYRSRSRCHLFCFNSWYIISCWPVMRSIGWDVGPGSWVGFLGQLVNRPWINILEGANIRPASIRTRSRRLHGIRVFRPGRGVALRCQHQCQRLRWARAVHENRNSQRLHFNFFGLDGRIRVPWWQGVGGRGTGCMWLWSGLVVWWR